MRQTFGRFKKQDKVQELRYGVLRVGRDLAFVALPGEPFVGLQLDLKARSPVAHTFMLGYTNGYAYANGYTNTYCYTYTHAYAYANSHTNTDTDTVACVNADSSAHSHAHADAHANTDSGAKFRRGVRY